MPEFEFETNETLAEFCREIAKRMSLLFNVSITEAIGRINRDWRGLKLSGEEWIIYREGADYWAKSIYYGHGANWWLGDKDLKPRPYP